MLSFVCKIKIQERELNRDDFKKCIFKNGWCLDTYKANSFKLGMMIGKTKLCLLIPLQMTDFDSRSQCYKKARTCAVILL